MRIFRTVSVSCVLGLVVPVHAGGAQQGTGVWAPPRFEMSVGADMTSMPYEIAGGCGNAPETDRRGYGAQLALRARPARGFVVQADVRASGASSYDCTLVEHVFIVDANTTERRSNFTAKPGIPGAGHVDAMLRGGADVGYSNLRLRALAGIGLMPAKRSLPLYSASVALSADRMFFEAEYMRTRVDGATVVDRRFAPPGATPVKTIIVTPVRRTPSWMTYRVGFVVPLGGRK